MAFTYTYYGHGTHGLKIGEHKIVIDPYFNNNPSSPVKVEDVEADYILVSHGHNDHVEDVEALAKRTGALVISNNKIEDWFNKKGLEKTLGQMIGGKVSHPFGYLKFTYALHGSDLPDGSNGGMAAGLLITTEDKQRIYFACDTALFGDMRLIGDAGITLAVLPIGDYFTMGPEDALKAVKLIEPKNVVPCHYNTWPQLAQDGEAWAKSVEKETRTKAHVLKGGESLTF